MEAVLSELGFIYLDLELRLTRSTLKLNNLTVRFRLDVERGAANWAEYNMSSHETSLRCSALYRAYRAARRGLAERDRS